MSAPVKGIGVCLVPNEDGVPCGRQVAEGEPIGTVITAGKPVVGHRNCANEYHRRQQAQYRTEREKMVKIGKQEGPGGVIGDPASYPDALASGSYPLEKKSPPVMDTPPSGATHDENSWVEQARWAASLAADLTASEQAQLAQYRAELVAQRQSTTHTVDVDLTGLSPEITAVEIRLRMRDDSQE